MAVGGAEAVVLATAGLLAQARGQLGRGVAVGGWQVSGDRWAGRDEVALGLAQSAHHCPGVLCGVPACPAPSVTSQRVHCGSQRPEQGTERTLGGRPV